MAKEMMFCTKNENKMNRWMWKYTSFSSQIKKYKKKLNMKCKRIISFGDGRDEYKALNHYSSRHGVEAIHISFICAPTICQLRLQWQYIEKYLDKMIANTNGINTLFYAHDLSHYIDTDNNVYGTGKSDQLPEIAAYFQVWMG